MHKSTWPACCTWFNVWFNAIFQQFTAEQPFLEEPRSAMARAKQLPSQCKPCPSPLSSLAKQDKMPTMTSLLAFRLCGLNHKSRNIFFGLNKDEEEVTGYSYETTNEVLVTWGIRPPRPTETSDLSCIIFMSRRPKQRHRDSVCRKCLREIGLKWEYIKITYCLGKLYFLFY